MHLQSQNFVEAALTLKLHSDLHEWDLNTSVEPMEDLGLPRQTAFARKETLCLLILDYLGSSILFKSTRVDHKLSLQERVKLGRVQLTYARSCLINTPKSPSISERKLLLYRPYSSRLIITLSARLSEILMHQATLLEHIVTDQRHYPDYFMVAFCGSFPIALRNKQYIVSLLIDICASRNLFVF